MKNKTSRTLRHLLPFSFFLHSQVAKHHPVLQQLKAQSRKILPQQIQAVRVI